MLRCSAALNCNTVQGQTAFSWERIDLLVSSHHYWVFLNVPRPRRATLSRVQSIQSIFRFSARLTVTRPAILGGRPAGQTLFSRSIPCLFLNVSLEKKDLNKKRTSEGGAQVAKGRKEGAFSCVFVRSLSLSLSLFVTNTEVKLAMQFRTLHLDWQPTRPKWIAKYTTKLLAADPTAADALGQPVQVRRDVKTNLVNT